MCKCDLTPSSCTFSRTNKEVTPPSNILTGNSYQAKTTKTEKPVKKARPVQSTMFEE